MRVDWGADIFLLVNLRNCPQIRARIPERIVERALASGRAAVVEEAWVDVCPHDMPCGGDRSRCLTGCDRSYANHLYSNAYMAVFNSPMQRRMIASVIDVPLPHRQLLSPPMIDVDRFRHEGRARDIDVLYVGTISKAKGYYNLLAHFGEDRLTLAGPNNLGEPVRGRYLGPVPNDELPALYNRARIFAHLPEWYEPMGRTVVEASLCGCAVVLNDRVGVASYPKPDWNDPEVVRGHPDEFWRQLEALV
jgi:glycosyltransferase involved in cell wall biosynthesis